MSIEIPLESKAISVLETYEGSNNYLVELKRTRNRALATLNLY